MTKRKSESKEVYLKRQALASREYRKRFPDKKKEQDRIRRDAWLELVWMLRHDVCSECGELKHPAVMQFDHVPERGVKVFLISDGRHHSVKNFNIELAKTDLVCGDCHLLRTWERRQ